MPFADAPGGVALVLHDARDGSLVGGNPEGLLGQQDAYNTTVDGIAASEQGSAGRRADRRSVVEIRKLHAFRAHAVQVRRADGRVAARSHSRGGCRG